LADKNLAHTFTASFLCIVVIAEKKQKMNCPPYPHPAASNTLNDDDPFISTCMNDPRAWQSVVDFFLQLDSNILHRALGTTTATFHKVLTKYADHKKKKKKKYMLTTQNSIPTFSKATNLQKNHVGVMNWNSSSSSFTTTAICTHWTFNSCSEIPSSLKMPSDISS
jgi:hypothetical protein